MDGRIEHSGLEGVPGAGHVDPGPELPALDDELGRRLAPDQLRDHRPNPLRRVLERWILT